MYGFSLLEALVTLAILSILVTLSYTIEQSISVRAHRLDGQTALVELAYLMEKYYAKHNTYEHANFGNNADFSVRASNITQAGWYQLVITQATTNGFLLAAVPIKSQAQLDTMCQTLTINQLGIKNIQAGTNGSPLGDAYTCWR